MVCYTFSNLWFLNKNSIIINYLSLEETSYMLAALHLWTSISLPGYCRSFWKSDNILNKLYKCSDYIFFFSLKSNLSKVLSHPICFFIADLNAVKIHISQIFNYHERGDNAILYLGY